LNGFAFDSAAFTSGEGTPLLRIRDLKTGIPSTHFNGAYSQQYLVQQGDLLIGMDGEFRCYSWAGEPALLNQRVCKLIPELSRLDPDFLRLSINAHLSKIEGETSFTTVKHISSKQVLAIALPLPSLSEQKRIASQLNGQFAVAERARTAASQRLLAAELLSSAELRDAFASERTQSWRRVMLGTIAEVVGGIQKSPDRTPSGFSRPYLTVRNVQHGRLDLTKVEEFEITPRELARLRLQEGDLLIVEGNGSLDHIGRNALFNEPGEWIHQNHVIRVRLDRRQVVPDFASLYFQSPWGRAQMIEKAKTTSGLYTLSTGKVEALDLPLPAIPDQKRLVAKLRDALTRAEALVGTIKEELHSLERMPAALLRVAFNGDT
jgi:type I restriction enzyme S subunit